MHDTIQRFIIEDMNCRCVIIRLDATLKEILSQYTYPLAIQQFLSECLCASALCSATLKYRGQLTLQMQAEGPIKMIVAKCNDQFDIRGLARFENVAEDELKDAFEHGKLVVTIQADNNAKTYQSIINLNENLAQSFADYFMQSEQINTTLAFAHDGLHSVGVLCQALPADDQPRMTLIPNTIDAKQLFSMTNADFLQQLFSGQDIRVFPETSVRFACTCSMERSLASVKLMSKDEIEEIFAENPYLVVTCEYCNHEYSFNREDIND